jgi:MoxR-like ATPase
MDRTSDKERPMHARTTAIDLAAIHRLRNDLVRDLSQIIYGSEQAVLMMLATTLSPRESHLLLEDVPGVGKTTLLNAFAQALGLTFKRIQGPSAHTADDLTGYYRPDPQTRELTFLPGPMIANIVLLDEVNRATPKALNGLLQGMEEEEITVDGITHVLPSPYFVVASQNAIEIDEGTYEVLLSLKDRFMARLRLGYPSREDARRMLHHRRRPLERDERGRRLRLVAQPLVRGEDLQEMRFALSRLQPAEGTVNYVEQLVECSRNIDGVRHGLSPRAALVLLELAISWAALHAPAANHLVVRPEHVAAVWPAVASHRLDLDPDLDESDPLIRATLDDHPDLAGAPLDEIMARAIFALAGTPDSWAQEGGQRGGQRGRSA